MGLRLTNGDEKTAGLRWAGPLTRARPLSRLLNRCFFQQSGIQHPFSNNLKDHLDTLSTKLN